MASEYFYVLLEISIILFLAEMIRSSLAKFNLPSLVGEVLTGLIISPYAIGGFLNSILGVELFSLNIYLLFLAEFSVILLVFAAGLEHGMAPLRKAGINGYLGAFFGAFLPFIVAFLFYEEKLGFNSALILGVVMGATSLAAVSSIIYYKKLSGKGIEFLMTAAAIDDVIDLIMLSVVLGIISVAQLTVVGIATTIAFYSISWLIIFIIAVLIIPRVFDKIHEAYLEEFMFLTIFGLVAIMVSLGFSAVIAAFIAGVAIAGAAKKEKVKHITDVLVALFGALFFVSIGMQMNINKLNFDLLIFALDLTFIAMLFKFLGIIPFALLHTRNIKKAIAISIGMTPRGEMGLVVASIGASIGVLASEALMAIVFMALFTTLLGATFFNMVSKWME